MNDKELSREITASLASEDLQSLLAAARTLPDHSNTHINGSAALRKVLLAPSVGTIDTLSSEDWKSAKGRASAYAITETDSDLVFAAHFFDRTVSARLALNSARCKGPVWNHKHRDAALKVLECFYDTSETAPTLDRKTLVNGASAIGEFDLKTGDETALVDFLGERKSLVSGTGH